MTRAPSPEGLTAGVALIGLGVLWTLSNLGHLDLLAALRILWPVMFLVWGAAELLAQAARRAARNRGSSLAPPVFPSQLDGSDRERP